MHIEGFLPVNLCLVTLLSSEQCSQFKKFQLQHVQMINKTFSFKTKLIGSNTEATIFHRGLQKSIMLCMYIATQLLSNTAFVELNNSY